MNFTSFQSLIFKFSVFILLKRGCFRLQKQVLQALKIFVSMRPGFIVNQLKYGWTGGKNSQTSDSDSEPFTL